MCRKTTVAKSGIPKGYAGQTAPGHTRDVKTDRIGHVTIYKRGRTYYLYYRENGKSRRQRVEGNLNNARQAASNVNHALEESRPSPSSSRRWCHGAGITGHLGAGENR